MPYCTISRFPLQSLTEVEPEEHNLYQRAYRKGRQNKQQECSEMFPGCPISLIDLALGYYSGYDNTWLYNVTEIKIVYLIVTYLHRMLYKYN